MLSLVGLEALAGRSVQSLSGGEAQRVALARALAPSPSLLMLDEPFGSLDRVRREELTGELSRLLRELDQTAIHVTHDQQEAFALADRVVILAEGRVLQVDTPDRLWHHPASADVARFLGHPNIWRVRAERGELFWGSVPLGPAPDGDPGSRTVVVPVAALCDAGPGEPCALEVTVRGCELREGRWRLHGDTASGPVAWFSSQASPAGVVRRVRVDVSRAVSVPDPADARGAAGAVDPRGGPG
jgi:thiamine transport system ATP-binding protein